MTMTETMWLRSQSAQRDFLNLLSYGTAFAGTAALQALSFSLTAPRVYWAAMGRVARYSEVRTEPEAVPDAAALVAQPDPDILPETAPETAAPQSATSPHLLDGPRDTGPDDLTVLAGVGTKLARALNEFGIYHYDQIASLDQLGIDWLDAQQKGFRMICARYDLVGQAKALS